MRKRLTRRQSEVLDFIRDFIKKNNYPPSIQEISNHMGHKSRSTTFTQVNALVEKGYILKTENGPRTIRLAEDVSKPAFPKMNEVQLKFFVKDTIISTLAAYGLEANVDQVRIEETVRGKKGYIELVIDLDSNHGK